MPKIRALDADRAKMAKAELWGGTTEDAVALKYGISRGTVAGMKSGRVYYETAWPDGTVGSLPHSRRLQLMENGRRVSKGVSAIMNAASSDPRRNRLQQLIEEHEAELDRLRNEKALSDMKDKYPDIYTNAGKEWIAAGRPVEEMRQEPRPIIFEQTTHLVWETVLRTWPGVLVVAEAELTNDQRLKDAVCIVLATWPAASIESDQLAYIVHQVAERLTHEHSE